MRNIPRFALADASGVVVFTMIPWLVVINKTIDTIVTSPLNNLLGSNQQYHRYHTIFSTASTAYKPTTHTPPPLSSPFPTASTTTPRHRPNQAKPTTLAFTCAGPIPYR